MRSRKQILDKLDSLKDKYNSETDMVKIREIFSQIKLLMWILEDISIVLNSGDPQ